MLMPTHADAETPRSRGWQWKEVNLRGSDPLSSWGTYLLLALLCYWLASQAVRVEVIAGRSMEPTLANGQWVLEVDEPVARFFLGPVERGALVTFRAPTRAETRKGTHEGTQKSVLLIKRVVGLPGDTLLVRREHVAALDPSAAHSLPGSFLKWTWGVCAAGGIGEQRLRLALYRQGADELRPLAELSAARRSEASLTDSAWKDRLRRACAAGSAWRVRPLSAREIRRLKTGHVLGKAFPLYTLRGSAPDTVIVPSGSLYVLGDNRPVSTDSRVFGPVAVKSVQGRVVLF